MACRTALNFRNALGNCGLGDNHLRAAVILRFGLDECLRKCSHIMAINGHGIPSLRLEIQFCLLALRLVSHGIQRHVIRIVNEDKVIQFVVARKSNGFLRDALLQTAITV